MSDNILILADLTSPLMKPRIKMLEELPYKKYILHNANNIPLNIEILENYTNFVVLQHPIINSIRLRYLYSFFYTLYLLLHLNPKIIIVHWASRLYQNILLAIWGKRVIVHVMGGEINPQEDCYGKKKFFTGILFKRAKIITTKTEVMNNILLRSFPFAQKEHLKIVSWGVESRFFEHIANDEKKLLQNKILSRNFKFLFFSIRTFKKVHFHKEILTEFISCYGGNNEIGLIVSVFGLDNAYLMDCQNKLQLENYSNIIFVNVLHEQMHEYLHISDCIISYKLCDGISQSLMEAAASERWIISKELENHSMLLKHKYNAYLIDNISQLKEAFNYVTSHKLQTNDSDLLSYNSQKSHYIQILKQNFNIG